MNLIVRGGHKDLSLFLTTNQVKYLHRTIIKHQQSDSLYRLTSKDQGPSKAWREGKSSVLVILGFQMNRLPIEDGHDIFVVFNNCKMDFPSLQALEICGFQMNRFPMEDGHSTFVFLKETKRIVMVVVLKNYI